MTSESPTSDSSDASSQDGAPEAIVMFWRPGCGFCAALDRQLASLGLPVAKVNIWEEPDGAAFVRSHANGNETVPTVAIGESVLVNPTPKDVVAVMRSETPHLVPADLPEATSLFARLRGR